MHGSPEGTPSRGGVLGGRRVGRKPAFTADDVVAAAVAEGVDRFTLAAVARRIGVVTPAIYRLFPSRDDLVVACLDAAAATLAVPADGSPWRDTLQLWADECWRVCEDFPGLSRLVYSFPPAMTRVDDVLTAYSAVLTAQGCTPGQVRFALDFIGDTVFASHLGIESMRATDDDGVRGIDRMRQAIGERAVAMPPQEWWTGRGALDTKIAFILAGLERHWPEL
ncbi:TetR/AcrR family transcriptional regulator [Gordonia sp. PP30]|uniref:TetR/AcrR family transcriptional regulator n=1 Tax=Gordonia sp. PP30 TaxID=2935861 RepID=UPI00200028A7|nr:TetR/AcrR family transcriptional regulator [Gordonia sp. PP30]UQE75484.1 TetR/AcrR family transcriptional regulator [Gordonia sp. PP30]